MGYQEGYGDALIASTKQICDLQMLIREYKAELKARDEYITQLEEELKAVGSEHIELSKSI